MVYNTKEETTLFHYQVSKTADTNISETLKEGSKSTSVTYNVVTPSLGISLGSPEVVISFIIGNYLLSTLINET